LIDCLDVGLSLHTTRKLKQKQIYKIPAIATDSLITLAYIGY